MINKNTRYLLDELVAHRDKCPDGVSKQKLKTAIEFGIAAKPMIKLSLRWEPQGIHKAMTSNSFVSSKIASYLYLGYDDILIHLPTHDPNYFNFTESSWEDEYGRLHCGRPPSEQLPLPDGYIEEVLKAMLLHYKTQAFYSKELERATKRVEKKQIAYKEKLRADIDAKLKENLTTTV